MTAPAAANLIYGYYLGTPNSSGFDGVKEADCFGNLHTDWFYASESSDAYDLSCVMHEKFLIRDGMTREEWDALEDAAWEDELAKRLGIRILLLGFMGVPQMYLVTAADWIRGQAGQIPKSIYTLYPSPGGEDRLRAALRVLGVTPKIQHPRWMIVPCVN